jgi:hypothetical protein
VQCIDIKLLAISNKTALLVCDMLTRVHVKKLPMVIYLNSIKDLWMAEKTYDESKSTKVDESMKKL